jgi:sulfonate transport system substrate-binding protein
MRLTSPAICAAFAMLSLWVEVADSRAAEPAKVRVGYINNTQSAVMLQMKAIQKDENLDIDLIPFTRYPDVQRAIAANSVDIGPIAPNGLPTAVAQGDRNVIAVMDLAYGGDSMIIRKGVEVQKFQDLKAKRIGLAEGGIAWMMFVMLLDKNGMTYNDIRAVNFSAPTDMVNAIKRGDVDAVDLWEPFLTQTVVEGYGNISPVVNYNETPLASMNSVLGANRTFATGHEDALVAALRVVLKSEQQIEKDHQIWVNIVRGYSNLDEATINRALGGIHYGGPQLSRAKLDAIATFIAKAGIVKQDVTGKLGENADPRFLAKAVGKSEAEVLK